MKKIVLTTLFATGIATIPVCALPAYEPFTEYAPTIASQNSTYFVTYHGAAVASFTNNNQIISNAIDLATNLLIAPSGEAWTALNFSGTSSSANLTGGGTTNSTNGIDICVVSNVNIFTFANVSPLWPSGFPGFPAAGGAITNIVENPAQPAFNNTVNNASQDDVVGNSAVLTFANDITRPVSGSKTLYISFLYNIQQLGQLGTGNDGRIIDFVASTNLVEGAANNAVLGPSSIFKYWAQMFNNFNATTESNRYVSFGMLEDTASLAYFGAADCHTGKSFTTGPTVSFGSSVYFVVGEYTFNSTGSDTMTVWVDPATTGFGGPTAASGGTVYTLTINMTDIGGFVIEDRAGSGASGGAGTNFMANLMLGSTWSYVTGGPEFTNQPVASTLIGPGSTVNLSAAATAAGQTVSYQWYKVNGSSSNVVTSGAGGAGGSAVVSFGTTNNVNTMTLAGVSSGDGGTYVAIASASSTSYTLASSNSVLQIQDPGIVSQPQPTSGQYDGSFTLSATVESLTGQMSYAWYNGSTMLVNGTLPDGAVASNADGSVSATNATFTLTLTNISYLDAGNYTLQITNANSSVTVTAPAAVSVADPIITADPPAFIDVATGTTGTISVGAIGSGVTYSWQWTNANGANANGGEISGTSSSTLTISPASSGDAGTYEVVVSGASGQFPATTPTIVYYDTVPSAADVSPAAWTQGVGTHFAVIGTASGGSGVYYFYWQRNGVPLANGLQADGSYVFGIGADAVAGANEAALILSNLQVGDSGTYTVAISNAAGTITSSSSCVVTVTTNYLMLSTNNVVVSRVGDGSELLSGTTGNTLYLDQFTTNGTYVNTIMVPDSGSGKLLAVGGGADWQNEAYMTLSSNGGFLNFAGYFQNYPSANVQIQGASGVRSIGAVDALGVYTLAYTNFGLYSGGLGFIRDAYSTDGLTNFWTTGAAAGGTGIKYVNAGPLGAAYAGGSGVPGLGFDVTNGPICIGLVGTNLVFSDNTNTDYNGLLGEGGGLTNYSSAQGLNIFAGFPTSNPNFGGASNMIFMGCPADFACSPDLMTIYVADSTNSANDGNGGIQRYDFYNGLYNFSYIIYDTTGIGTNGLCGLTVYFPPGSTGLNNSGAVLYATSSENQQNRLIQIIDNGGNLSTGYANNPTVTLLATAGTNQLFRGVRFGPAEIPVSIVSPMPASISTYAGATNVLTPGPDDVAGDPPYSYQWQLDGTNIMGATGSSLALTNIQANQAGTYTLIVSDPFSSATNSTVVSVSDGPISAMAPRSLVETVGDHTAFAADFYGLNPLTYQWSFDGTNIMGATNSSLVLTNIQLTNGGTYSIVCSDTDGSNSASATLQVTPGSQQLGSNNLVVLRLGDGAQALSSSTGNTVYLDQLTTSGVYSNTIMIPDNSATANLILPGGLTNGLYNGFLNLSVNDTYLNFCGFNTTYPASTFNVPATFRIMGAVSSFGEFIPAQINQSLYDAAGDLAFDCVASVDGLNEFWTTGAAGSGSGLKYSTTAYAGSAGGIPSIGGSLGGTRVVKIVGGNVVYSDSGSSTKGIYGFVGQPVAAATSALIITDAAGNPNDFAASPDTLGFPPPTSTLYVSDNSIVGSGGGVQRYDWNGNAYALSYTLGTGAGVSNGASGLVVDFSANATWGSGVTGAIIYATTAGASNNSLIKIIDNGSGSGATVLEQANANQLLRGIRFGPVFQPLAIATNPASISAVSGQEADFPVAVTGSGPFTYQWQSNGMNILGATANPLCLFNVQSSNAASYTVIVSNPGGTTVTSSPPAVLAVSPFNPASGALPMVGWWQFNDGTETNAADSSTYGDTAALYNFPGDNSEWIAGLGGDFALDFTNNVTNANTGTFVLAPDEPQLNFSNGLAFTIAAWVQNATNSQLSGAALVEKGYGNGGEQYNMDIVANGSLKNAYRFYVRNAGTETVTLLSTNVPNTNGWDHVAVTFDGYSQTMNLYVNGQLSTNLSNPNNSLASLLFTSSNLDIGNRSSSATSGLDLPLLGAMQDVRMYDVALGIQDIQAIYNLLAPPGILVFSNSLVLVVDNQATAVNFGSNAAGSFTPITFLVTNPGPAALTLGTVTASSGFTVVTQPPAAITAGGSGIFSVNLTSSTQGANSGTVTIPNNVPLFSPFSFPVTGIVGPPATPAPVVWAQVPVTGAPSAPVLHFSGQAGGTYHLWSTTSIAQEPVETKWTLLSTGTFSGGNDTFNAPAGSPGSTTFYAITQP